MNDQKAMRTLLRSIKAIAKENSTLTPSQKRKLCETLIPLVDSDVLDDFVGFNNFLHEGRQAIILLQQEEKANNEKAKEALIDALKTTKAFEGSRKSPEEFILELLNQSAIPKKKTSKSKSANVSAKTEVPEHLTTSESSPYNAHDSEHTHDSEQEPSSSDSFIYKASGN